MMQNTIQKIYSDIKQFTLSEGKNQTNIPYLSIYKYTQNEIVLPNTPKPFIYLVVNGTLQLHFAEGIKDYTAGQYFVATIDSPRAGQALSVSSDIPFLALFIEFSIDDVISVMLDIDGDFPEKLFEAETSITIQSQDDKKLLNVISRLLNMNEHTDELSFMGKHLKREIIFDVIIGPYGKQFLQSIINIQQAGDIYFINNWIKQNYKDTFTVEELAEQSNMSLSSFHQKFKNAVGMGPLQCQKNFV